MEKSGSSVMVVLLAVFLTLKLTGQITWSWWWVLAPLWGPFAVGAAVMVIAFLILSIIEFVRWG